MEYKIISRSITVTTVVEYTLDNGNKVTIAVPIFDPQSSEDENSQIEYRGDILNNNI